MSNTSVSFYGRVSVTRFHDAERLSATRWDFMFSGHWMILKFYGEQTRETRRHKFTGPFWDSTDERKYHSKLERPTQIPEDVVTEAIAAAVKSASANSLILAVGFENHKCAIGTANSRGVNVLHTTPPEKA